MKPRLFRNPRRHGWPGFVLALLAPVSGHCADLGSLQEFIQNTDSVAAHFEQVVRDADGVLMDASAGEMVVQRPNRFHWDYREPAPQQVVSDGETLWLYDVELEQVTVQRLDRLQQTPAELLGDDWDTLLRKYTVRTILSEQGLELFELTPKSADPVFRQVTLGFADSRLVRMELSDSLGQTTVLTFSDMRINPDIEAGIFRFVPPAGVDVIYND